MSDDSFVIGCYRVADLPVPYVKEAVAIACDKCNALMWVAPSSFQIAIEKKAPLMCLQCLRMMAAGEPAVRVELGVHPLQRLEWQEYMRSLGARDA